MPAVPLMFMHKARGRMGVPGVSLSHIGKGEGRGNLENPLGLWRELKNIWGLPGIHVGGHGEAP